MRSEKSRLTCGIVSNFMVENGIEELLSRFGVIQYFSFVVTSVGEGWKKPHSRIYDTAARLAKVANEKILFIGDNYECDYIGPRNYGFHSILLDKENRYPRVADSINSMDELLEKIK